MIAEDFVPGWEHRRPEFPDELEPIRQRVGKEIAHLTYNRFCDDEPEAKLWNQLKVAFALQRVIPVFLRLVPDDCLYDKLRRLRTQLSEQPA
jgi:hypothetical protein